MTKADLDLLHGYLNGTLDKARFGDFQRLLRDSSEARATLRALATVDTKLQQFAAAGRVCAHLLPRKQVRNRRFANWFSRRPVATGLVIGLLGASAAWATALPWLGEVRQVVTVLFRESFESGVTGTAPGLPSVTALWSGDEAKVVSGEQDIEPFSGAYMLRFRSATYQGENSPRSQWGDVYRIVEVPRVSAPKGAVARITAAFAESAKPLGTHFSGYVEGYTIDGELDALPSPLTLSWLRQNASASGSRRLSLAEARKWQDVAVAIPISARTRYILLHLAVIQEQPLLESGAVEFHGLYMDDVRLELVMPQ